MTDAVEQKEQLLPGPPAVPALAPEVVVLAHEMRGTHPAHRALLPMRTPRVLRARVAINAMVPPLVVFAYQVLLAHPAAIERDPVWARLATLLALRRQEAVGAFSRGGAQHV